MSRKMGAVQKQNKPSGVNPEKGKITLPAYGFAEDILGKKNTAESPKETSTAKERIYTFADRLIEKQEKEAHKIIKEKYEIWVTFTLVNEFYALPVTHVQEMLRALKITRVPDTPYPIRGITNMRGRILPVVDLRLRLGLKKGKINNRSRILVTESKGRLIGLLVDSVEQVTRFFLEQIKPPPKDIVTEKSKYITGVYYLNESPIILLELDQLLLIHTSQEHSESETQQGVNKKKK